MNEATQTTKAKSNANKTKRSLSIVLIVVGVALITFASYRLISGHLEYLSARNEYDELRDIFSVVTIQDIPRMPAMSPEQGEADAEPHEPMRVWLTMPQGTEDLVDPMEALLEINPDFVAWIRIGDVIDYPIVQGRDNNRYLHTTFQGSRNSSGAIFLDYRNSSDLNDEVSIIYGHNMRDGSMFKPLHQLRYEEFLSEHQYITVITSDWRMFIYRIFAVRTVDTWQVENNPEQLTIAEIARSVRGTPEDAEHIIILSTCTTSANRAERLRVYATRIDYVPGQR